MMTIITSVPTVRKLFLIAFWGVSPETQVKVNFWTTCKNNEHLWSQHTVAPLKTIWHEPLYVAIEPLYVYLLGQAVPIMVGIDPILDNRMWSDKNIRVGNFEETFWSELVSLLACEPVSLWACELLSFWACERLFEDIFSALELWGVIARTHYSLLDEVQSGPWCRRSSMRWRRRWRRRRRTPWSWRRWWRGGGGDVLSGKIFIVWQASGRLWNINGSFSL